MVIAAESVARFAALLADRTRAAICLALLDGRAWTAGELARHAGVTRSTASEHLTALVEAGLLAQERQGRHRYVRLTGHEVATLIEDITGAVGQAQHPTSLRSARVARELATARTCYDHLAGVLGVALFDALVAAELLEVGHGLSLAPAGRDWFTHLAGDSAVPARTSRPLLRACLDWTERRAHLGGALGAVLHHQLLHRAWVRPSAPHRAVILTPEGAKGLQHLLGHDFGPLTTPGIAATRPPADRPSPRTPGYGDSASMSHGPQ